MVDFFNPSITSRLLNSITRNPSGLQSSLSKVASGKRLINASVDPAGLAVSEKLRSDLAALSQAINQEFQQIVAEIDRVAQSTQFNGQNLLNGDLAPAAPPVEIQVGIGGTANDRIALNVIDATDAAALGIAGLDLSTAAGAQAALAPLDAAQQTVLGARSNAAALAGRLESVAASSRSAFVALTDAQSRIADADLVQEISDLGNALLRLETSIRALAIQNRQSADNVGRLLNIRA